MDEERAFQQRFDIARLVLERKYRWARRVLRNLQPVRRDSGTMAVDKHLRLYWGPAALTWADKEFVGALWHEVNHVLRHHPERLSHLPKKHNMEATWVNVAADLEINDDLREQGITLPADVMYSERFQHLPGQSAEQHFLEFVEQRDQEEQQQQNADEQDQDEGEQENEGGTPGAPSNEQGGQDKQKNQDKTPADGSNETGGRDIPENDCGSAADGEQRDYEEPEPDPDEQGKLDRELEKQDEEVVQAVEQEGGLPPGMSAEVYQAAVKRLGKSEHDWRQTIAVEVRNAMEQRADEAEEYTFRRRSRRAGVSDEFILPGSFRPIPRLGAVVDVSGSMDARKLTATMRELHGILERLAIPSFTAYSWNTRLTKVGAVPVQTARDIETVLSYRGGGTDMQYGVDYAVEQGDEVIIVLTDNETRWRENGPEGVPVIICGINRRKDTHSYPVPEWARLVDVMADEEVE